MEETAEALHVSPDTVMRDWKLAKAWLLRELRGDDLQEPSDADGLDVEWRARIACRQTAGSTLERLYHAALERPAEERAAFLAEACVSDEALRREVLSRFWSSRRAGIPWRAGHRRCCRDG